MTIDNGFLRGCGPAEHYVKPPDDLSEEVAAYSKLGKADPTDIGRRINIECSSLGIAAEWKGRDATELAESLISLCREQAEKGRGIIRTKDLEFGFMAWVVLGHPSKEDSESPQGIALKNILVSTIEFYKGVEGEVDTVSGLVDSGLRQ